MSVRGKQKGSSRHYFVLEEGELSDIEDDDKNEKEIQKQRDDDFIREWSERQNKNEKTAGESDAEMDIISDDETGKIDTKPVAMTITFLNECFSSNFKSILESTLAEKFGSDNIDTNSACIFVLHERKSTELTNSVTSSVGVLTIVFHDLKFSEDYFTFMQGLCQGLFGMTRVTNSDNWLLEVLKEDFLDFQLDTEPFGYENNLIYSKITIKNKNPPAKNGRLQSCFNCLGNHSLRDCKVPRNYKNINENKAKFQTAKLKTVGRYHTEREKYSDFVPGQISKNLRLALGLNSEQCPLHVYKMRKYGYPPGWLLESKIAHSGVSVYGKDGIIYEEGEEIGEIIDEAKDLFDIKKLVAFPGFNTPLPEDVIDECKEFDLPEISEEQSLNEMKNKLMPNAVKAYKKKALLPRETSLDDDEEEEVKYDDENDSFQSPVSSSVLKNISSESSSQTIPSTPATPVTPVAVDFGTPVLASYSPFSKLPARDKFASDVCDVINFENLPDSTGTYEKMVDSIAKIRKYNSESGFR